MIGHLGDERGLAEPLLVDAARVEVLVAEDRVVHPHAALVEDAEDRHPIGELARRSPPRSSG
jgi:hypothetical protein